MEFGSDFHSLDYPKGKSLLDILPDHILYASGRQALLDLAIFRNWKRLWVPSYFCYESMDVFSGSGIELCQYEITPLIDPITAINRIPVKINDGLLIVNYFGLFDVKRYPYINCEIVEDHTHNLIGGWAVKSKADWCIASLRKTLPIPDGGILWSPKRHSLPASPLAHDITNYIMKRRTHAMDLKEKYLSGGNICKNDFLTLFKDTEEKFDELPVSAISEVSLKIVSELDISRWYGDKHRNWEFLYENLNNCTTIEILSPENSHDCPFSLTLRFGDSETRNKVRQSLIDKSVYPAILWTIHNDIDKSAITFGDTMLSIHCDARYSPKDMRLLLQLINDSIE